MSGILWVCCRDKMNAKAIFRVYASAHCANRTDVPVRSQFKLPGLSRHKHLQLEKLHSQPNCGFFSVVNVIALHNCSWLSLWMWRKPGY